MAILYIRNVPDKLYRKLKEQAKLNRRSIAQEVVTLIQDTIDKKTKRVEVWEEMETLRQRILKKYGRFDDSAVLIREDRGR
jgi:plasmid stability protein